LYVVIPYFAWSNLGKPRETLVTSAGRDSN
jgi:hypothetical protein